MQYVGMDIRMLGKIKTFSVGYKTSVMHNEINLHHLLFGTFALLTPVNKSNSINLLHISKLV